MRRGRSATIAAPPDGSTWEYQESLVKGRAGDFLLVAYGTDRVWITERMGKTIRTEEIATPDPRAAFVDRTIRYVGRKVAEGAGAEVRRSCPARWRAPWQVHASGQVPFPAPADAAPAFSRQWSRILGAAGRDADLRSAVSETGKVWRPKSAYTLVDGDLVVDGNIAVATGAHDSGALLVRGSIRCRNLRVGSGFALACAGDLIASEAVLASAADSDAFVGGSVRARLLDSGSGAWLTIFSPRQLAAEHVTSYVMVGSRPLRPKHAADLKRLLVPRALDDEERDDQYLQVDEAGARALLDRGASILRRPA